MNKEIEIIKGVHPGFVLERLLKEKKIKKGQLALSIMEYPQTITTITKGNRGMNTALALKLEKILGLEEGYFMILQTYYDIKIEKAKSSQKPDIANFRSILFWDTKIDKLDWQKQYKAIIHRVFERGNDIEKTAITRFYGRTKIKSVLADKKTKRDVLEYRK